MTFQQDKKNTLQKKDKSKKGSIDKDIKDLVDIINSKDNYYTTSSCSGRIIILYRKTLKKIDAKWLFTSHSPVRFEDIKKVLKDLPAEKLWFKQEPAIIHVCSRSIKDAQKLVDHSKEAGFRRTGIQTTGKKILLEIGSSECMETIIAKDKKILIDDSYLKVIIEEANNKMKNNKEKLKKLYKLLSNY